MPFTASHIAIIIPLLKRRVFSVSGLIMGSMVPDFEFFIRLQAHTTYGHSFWPMFWLNIPTAIFCITLYHLVVRNQLILNLPLYFKKRFQPFLNFDWISYLKTNYVKVSYSIVVGNISHLLWDSFTHYDGFAVTKIAFLNAEYWQIPMYQFLQYGFSALGAIAILNLISKMPSYNLKDQFLVGKVFWYWFGILLVTALVYYLRYDSEDYHTFGAKIVFICAGFLIALLVISTIYNVLRFNRSIILSKRYQTKKL